MLKQMFKKIFTILRSKILSKPMISIDVKTLWKIENSMNLALSTWLENGSIVDFERRL